MSGFAELAAATSFSFLRGASQPSDMVAQAIALALQEREAEVGQLKIKISGCINACGHHHAGHIGILGVDKDGKDLTIPGTDLPAQYLLPPRSIVNLQDGAPVGVRERLVLAHSPPPSTSAIESARSSAPQVRPASGRDDPAYSPSRNIATGVSVAIGSIGRWATPRAASASMFGVRRKGWPVQPR